MGWLSVKYKQYIEVLRSLLRLRNMDQSRLTYRIFKWGFKLQTNFKKQNCEFAIKVMLNEVSKQDIYDISELNNAHQILSEFQQMVRDKHRLEWEEDLWNDREMMSGKKLCV